MELRNYQIEAIDRLRLVLSGGCKKPVMVLPTGGGKSIIFGQIIKSVLGNGKKLLWLVHRRNLVFQMRDVLQEFGIEPGLIMAGCKDDIENTVQLGTIQTYARRLKLKELELNRYWINADVVLIDEAHRSLSKQYFDVIELYRDKIVIGCTATPMRSDQRGLGEVYDSIVDIVDVKTLTSQGYLSPARYFDLEKPDLTGVKIRMGDYAVNELEKKHNTQQLNGDVVSNWLRLAENRKTIVFCVNVKHSIAVCEEFLKHGVKAEHLDARSPDEERNAVFERMQAGKTTVICNVGLYQEGLDVPDVSCISMARSTKSIGLWRQCGGRGLRLSELFDDCLILDHGGVIEELGFLDEIIHWSLDGKERAWAKPKKAKEKGKCKCTACGLVFEMVKVCPDCGSPIKTFGKKIETTNDELKEVTGKEKKYTAAEKRIFYGMLRHKCNEKGYSDGWIAHKFREKFSVWPKGLKETEPITPDKEFKNYMTYLNIKWAKSKKKAA